MAHFHIYPIIIASILLSPLVLRAEENLAERVVVVANAALPDSVSVARYYMDRRGIPEDHLITIETSTEETISRDTFNQTIANPILKSLIKNEWINAIADETDYSGQLDPILFKKSIDYLVLCYGIPVHVKGIENLDDSTARQRHLGSRFDNAFVTGPLAKNEASVDGELSVLLMSSPPRNGFIPNPYFQKVSRINSDVLKVTRLDGPSSRAVKKLIRQSIEGEKNGLKGRAYVDEDSRTGGFAIGNQWIADNALLFSSLGFSLSHNTERATLSALDRSDAPVLYSGWYTTDINQPFAAKDFRFPPGAVAVHLHSFSASPLRTTDKRWVGPLVDRGVSATVGNTAEPYLNYTHHLSILFRSLAQGMNFADAAYAALPGLSWQGIAVGDPLFKPFAVSLQDQLKHTGRPENSFLDQYVFLRQMNLADPDEKLSLAQKGLFQSPGPALAFELAQAYHKAGNSPAAVKALKVVQSYQPDSSQDFGLFRKMAQLFQNLDEDRLAFQTLKNLLQNNDLPKTLETDLLQQLIPLAESLNEFETARQAQSRLPQPEEASK